MTEQIIKGLIIAGTALYYIAFALHFSGRAPVKRIRSALWIAAFAANAAVVGFNWITNGYVPFVSMYQVLTFLALCFTPIFLYISYFLKEDWMARYFCLASGIVMTGVCFMDVHTVWHFPPALQSMWFVPHILAYMIGYSLNTVAFIITLISFFQKQQRQRLDSGVYHLVSTAFPFMSMGMLFGAIWANAVWGNFWSFDVKENWSLVTWLLFMLYLHFRRHKRLQKYTKVFVILGFVGIVITMLFVNMFGGSSQHAYSM